MAKGILYSQALVQSLENSLRSAFNQNLVLTRKPKNPGSKFVVHLRDGDKSTPDDEGYWLRKMLIGRDEPGNRFYFGFAAQFEVIAHSFTLQHSSLTVFHDIGEMMPLFRADFDPRASSDATSVHAQPHWHFVQRPELIEDIVKMMSSEPAEFTAGRKSELFSDLADSGKIHFAMSPLWEKNKTTAHKQDFDSTNFPKWFDHLATYIAGQIDYIVKKAPAAGVKEFDPNS